MQVGTQGLRCKSCSAHFEWRFLTHAIVASDRDADERPLVWEWRCPICNRLLRQEPFAFPPDYEPGVDDLSDEIAV